MMMIINFYNNNYSFLKYFPFLNSGFMVTKCGAAHDVCCWYVVWSRFLFYAVEIPNPRPIVADHYAQVRKRGINRFQSDCRNLSMFSFFCSFPQENIVEGKARWLIKISEYVFTTEEYTPCSDISTNSTM